ncbi:MAG: DNA-3-methyladenine glycosylase I [Acidobacteria bacterium]|nr:DNA-3-methyladenine glycosylase I [Acidobacteriota bacterium]
MTPTGDGRVRCDWCYGSELYVRYHDEEWGVPVRDDDTIFEFLVLEAFQAGLSWLTILRKRPRFRHAFVGFDPARVASFGEADVSRLLADAGIVRNRRKIEAAIHNARLFIDLQEKWDGFHRYIWRFVDNRPVTNQWSTMAEVPATTPLAETISAELRRHGFRFLGPTVVYAHMQATGMVNDHLLGCFRHRQVRDLT